MKVKIEVCFSKSNFPTFFHNKDIYLLLEARLSESGGIKLSTRSNFHSNCLGFCACLLGKMGTTQTKLFDDIKYLWTQHLIPLSLHISLSVSSTGVSRRRECPRHIIIKIKWCIALRS